MECSSEHVRLLEATAQNNFARAIDLQNRLWSAQDDMKAIRHIASEALNGEDGGFIVTMHGALRKIIEISGETK